MSLLYEVSYALEQRARERMIQERINATTEQYYNSYMDQYESLISNGYAAYIPDEMEQLRNDLATVRTTMDYDAREARNVSYQIGSYIRNMTYVARSARQEFERSERMRVEQLRAEKEEKRSELMKSYYEILQGISNPIVVNYSVEEMQKVKEDILSGNITTSEILKKKTDKIKANAEEKAKQWKDEKVVANKKKNISQILDDTEERLRREKIEDEKAISEFEDKMKKLRETLENSDKNIEEIESEIVKIETDIDETLITEETRRETVRAIIKQLNKQEFTVQKPQLINNDGKNYVKIIAQKPSGKRAVCNVDLNGKIAYKFDNYEGMTCLKDIERFNVDLEQIYSVKLSDERVLWSNPDKLSKDAETIPRNDGRNA